jgi:hypothetical protein
VAASLNAAFGEAVARLETNHADASADLAGDRNALLLRKAIGTSAAAVAQVA